jgi:hypothetical protein
MESVVPRPPLPARQIGHREARAGPGPLKWKRRTRVLQPNNAPQFRPRLRPEHPETSLMGSTTAACLRLLSDLKAITQEPPEGCSASPTSEENLFVWTATVFGPDETIWEGGIFCLRCGSALLGVCVHLWSADRAQQFNYARQTPFSCVFRRITFNENYPEKPPRIRFTTEIFHPNVYS